MRPSPRSDDGFAVDGGGGGGGGEAPAGTPAEPERPRRRRHHLSRRARILLFVAAWLLIALGVAGLVLPGIQGIVTIVAGLALLSVVSRRAHGWIRGALGRWPGLRRRVERLRWKVRRRFGRRQRDDVPPKS